MSAAAEAILDRVREYRLAARCIVEAHAIPRPRRLVAVIALVGAARNEPDDTVRRWAASAVAAEALPWIHGVKPRPSTNPWRRAQRRLRAAGYATCPECLRPVATDLELEMDERAERDAATEAAIRAEAVSR